MTGRVICILGMHRSGTSCLTGSLQGVGLFLGKVSNKNDFNLKGNRENRKIQVLQDGVLEANGGSWHKPPKSVVWSDEHYQQLCDIVASYEDYPDWGFKDPRTLFTLSGFQRCIDNLQFIGTFRNPKSVAASLIQRDANLDSQEYWLELWNEYNLRLIEIWQIHHFPIINFDQDDSAYQKSMERLLEQLGLTKGLLATFLQNGFLAGLKRIRSGKDNKVFFDPSLRSRITTSTENLPEHIKSTYRRLQEIAL